MMAGTLIRSITTTTSSHENDNNYMSCFTFLHVEQYIFITKERKKHLSFTSR